MSSLRPPSSPDAARRIRFSDRQLLLGLVVVGLALRVLYVCLSWDFVPKLDNYGYVQRGLYLWEHHGALMPLAVGDRRGTDAWWPPGYPIFLALLIALHQLLHVFGLIGSLPQAGVQAIGLPQPIHGGGILPLYQFLRLLSSCFGVLTVPLIAAIGRRMMGRRVGLAAAALMALYPPLIYVGASLYSESLFVVLMLTAIVCVLKFADARSWRWLVVGAVVTGYAILTHSDGVVMLVPLALGVWLAVHRKPWRTGDFLRSLWAPALLVLVTALTISPWTIRNAVKLHAFVPLSTSFGPTLAGTYNYNAAHDRSRPGGWWVPNLAYPQISARYWFQSPKTSKQFQIVAVKYIERHPTYPLTVAYWNTRRMFELNGPDGPDGSEVTAAYEGIPRGLTWVGDFAVWIVTLLAIASCFTRTVRRGRHRWVWLMPLVMYLSVVFITVETPRFRAGVDPFLVLGAAATLVSLWSRSRAAGEATPAPSQPPTTAASA